MMEHEHKKKFDFKFFYELVKPFKWHIIGMIFFGTLWAIFPIIRVYSFKLIVDGLTANQSLESLKNPIVVYFLAWFMIELFLNIRTVIVMHLNPYLKKHIIMFFTGNMLEYDDHFFRKNNSSALVTNLRNVYDGVEDVILSVEELLMHVVLTVSAVGSMYLIMPSYSYVIITWVVIWISCMLVWSKRGYILSKLVYDSRTMLAFYLGDIFANTTTIKTFNAIEYEKQIAQAKTQLVAQKEFNRRKLFLKIWITQGVFYGIVISISFWILLRGVKDGSVTIGSFTVLLSLLHGIYMHLFDVASDMMDFTEEVGKLVQGLEGLYREVKVIEDQKKQIEVKAADIVFEDIKYRYPDASEQENALNIEGRIEIKGGLTVALVGPSGGGKSTLFKLLLRLIEPMEGRVLIDGQDISKFSIESVRSQFALVPQEFGLFNRSMEENIKYGSFEAQHSQVTKVSHKAQIAKLVEELPNGYETIFGQETGLSGGQKQRLIIARGLLRNAKIFLFDESTSALDAKTEHDVLNNIHQTTKGCTKFIIAHRLNTVKNADLILVCDKGDIVEKGTHEELLENKGLYSSLMELI